MKADLVLTSAVWVGKPTHLADIGSRFAATKPGIYTVDLKGQPNPAENGAYIAEVDTRGMLTVKPPRIRLDNDAAQALLDAPHADTFEHVGETSVSTPDAAPTVTESP